MLLIKGNRGDTLIEVLLASAVFSLVAVGSLSIMNMGTASAQRALEISLVRSEIDSQAEALRFLNSSYISEFQPNVDPLLASYGTNSAAEQWRLIHNKVAGSSAASDFGNTASGSSCRLIPNNGFILNTRKAKALFSSPTPVQSKTFAQVVYNADDDVVSAEGVWIEGVYGSSRDPNQKNAGYIDFHIRACWDSPGQAVPVTLGTIVRLYEPR